MGLVAGVDPWVRVRAEVGMGKDTPDAAIDALPQKY